VVLRHTSHRLFCDGCFAWARLTQFGLERVDLNPLD